jgi:hypothetical protein
MRKYVVTILVLGLLVFVGGCGSSLANIGGGLATGGALSHTMTGMEKDLEIQEAKLIELYNKGIEDGAQKEYLDQIEKDIYDTQLSRQALKTGKQLFSVNWQDPKQTGGAIGSIAMLAYGYIKRKQLLDMTKRYKSHKQGAEKFMRENNDGTGQKLYADIAVARKTNKVA